MRDIGKTNPTTIGTLRLIQCIHTELPFHSLSVVHTNAHIFLIGPSTLEGNHNVLIAHGDTLETETKLHLIDSGGELDNIQNHTIHIYLEQEVKRLNRPVLISGGTTTLVRNPEGLILLIVYNTLHINVHGTILVDHGVQIIGIEFTLNLNGSKDTIGINKLHSIGNHSGVILDIDLEEATGGVEAILNGVQEFLLLTRTQTRQGRPGDGKTIITNIRLQSGVLRLIIIRHFVNVEHRADLIITIIHFRGNDQQTTIRNGHATLRTDTSWQDLHKHGVGRITGLVHKDQIRTLAIHEQVRGIVVNTVGDILRLVTLISTALFGVMTHSGGNVLHITSGCVDDITSGVEDGETTGSAEHITLIGRGEVLCAHPYHTVRFAGYGGQAGRHIDLTFLFSVNFSQIDSSGSEGCSNGGSGTIDEYDGIVLLKRDHGNIVAVDGNEFWFGIGGFVESIQADQFDRAHGEGGWVGAGDVENDDESGRHLGELSIAEVFIAFVFDGDCGVGSIG
mmetsp:Transcript_21297/g.31800  ORF Transcript_21297/g.31800 Transcript_21297/m.31800 type:complete len:507 (-) Transcript_21297:503-2023(-)